MTPHENAHEIFYRIYAWLDDKDKDTALELSILFSKMMLENADMICEGRNTETGLNARDEFRNYLNEVKKEIEKL
jgi:hypothetical protein